MKRFYLVLVTVLFTSSSVAQQWSYQAGGYGQGANLMGIYEVSEEVMFIQGFPMLRSGDGGNTWQYVSHEGDIFTATEPSFVDDNNGWVGAAKVDMHAPPGGFWMPYIPQVLRTNDAGITWSALDVSGLEELNTPRFIHFFDEQNGILAGETKEYGVLIYKTADGGRTWTKKFFSDELFGYADAQVINGTAYLSSANGILKSKDGGEIWQPVGSPADPSMNQVIYKVDFVSPTSGWVAGGGNLLARTSDGGATWINVNSGFDDNGTIDESGIYITGLKFQDSSDGYISTMSGTLHYTDDGGTTWQNRTPEDTDFSYNQDFLVSSDGDHVIFITSGDEILHSSDGGLTWQKKLDPLQNDMGLFDIAFADHSVGWAVGYASRILQTTDGGTHWDFTAEPAWTNENLSWQTLNSIAAPDAQHAWAVGDNGLLLQTSNGIDWIGQSVSENDFRDVFFLQGTDLGWIVGENYTLLHFDGTEWIPQVESREGMPVLLAVYFLDANHGWAVGQKGIILKTTNGGNSWALMKSGILRNLNDVFFSSPEVGYAVGDNDYILKTTDGGVTWRSQVIPHAFVGNMEGVYFSSPYRGWVVGSDEYRGAIYSTTDGGSTWNRAPVFGTSMKGVHFNDLNHGWAVDDSGKIYHFSDDATGSSDQSTPSIQIDFEPVADTLYNFDRIRFALIDSTYQHGGPFLGKNGIGDEEYAELYSVESDTWVAGVVVYHSGEMVHGENIAEYNVFSVDAFGYPDRKIGRKDIYFKDIELTKAASTILFNEPVPVNESFFVSFNLTDYNHGGFEGDNIGIMHTSDNTRPESDIVTRNVLRVHDHSDRVWRPIVEAHATSGYNGHLAIFPIVYQKKLVTGIQDDYPQIGILKILTAYPNPARDNITFAYVLQKSCDVATAIFNMQGEKILQHEPVRKSEGAQKETVDVRTLPPGLYIYKVQAGQSTLISKFVVTR